MAQTPIVRTKQVYASAPRTATPTAVTLAVGEHRGIFMVVDITAGSSLQVTPKIEFVDAVSGKAVQATANITQLTATGTTSYLVYPGAGSAAGGVTASTSYPVMGKTVKITMTHGNSNSATYTVSLTFIP